MRMRVLPGDFAMGGPAGVANASGAADGMLGEGFGQIVDPSDLFTDRDHALLDGSDPRGVISPVLEAAESFQKDGNGLGSTDITYDSTHGLWKKRVSADLKPRRGVLKR
jgi:hypothetical protein